MFQLRSRFYVDYSIKELLRSLINHTLNDETNRKEITKKLDNILTKDFNINDYLLYNYCRSAFKHILEFLKKKYPQKKNVLITNYTLPDFIDKVYECNLNPIFIDNKKYELFFDSNSAIDKLDQNTLAIVFTNLDSKIIYNKKILEKIQKLKIPIIEDNAIAFKKEFNNFKSTLVLKLYSFHFTKIVGSIRGGLISFNNKKFYNEFRTYYNKLNVDNNILKNKNLYYSIIIKFLSKKIIYNLFFCRALNFLKKNTNLMILRSNKNTKSTKENISISKMGIFEMTLLVNSLLNYNNFYIHKKKINKFYSSYLNDMHIKTYKEDKNGFLYEFPVYFKNALDKTKVVKHLRKKNIDVRENYYFSYEKNPKLKNSNKINYHIITLPNNKNIDLKYAKIICNELKYALLKT